MKAALRSLFAFRPPQPGAAELFLQRMAWAFVIYFLFFTDLRYQTQPAPNGLAQWFDFTFIGNPDTFALLKTGVGIALILYIAGVAPLVTIGYVLFVCVSYGTLRNSQNALKIHHGTQLAAMVVLGQFVAYAVAAFRARSRPLRILYADTSAHALAFLYARQMAVAGYMMAGIWKVHRSGLQWIADIPNISLQILKSGMQNFYGDARPDLRDHALEVAQFVIDHPHLMRVCVGAGLIAELVAFLVLLNRVQSFLIGITLIVMHLVIGWLMQLTFPENVAVCLIFFVNVPFLLLTPFLRPGARKQARLPSLS